MEKVWIFMIVASFVVAIFCGNIEAVTKIMFDSTGNAIEICLGIAGIVCMWSGFMKVAERSGLIVSFSKLLNPITKFLFPEIKKNNEVSGYIGMNIAANMLGLGNVATPIGIKVMEKLEKLNQGKSKISNSMLMFIVLNTASIQLIPTTVIALRANYNSQNPTSIVIPTFLSSFISVVFAITIVKIISKKEKK